MRPGSIINDQRVRNAWGQINQAAANMPAQVPVRVVKNSLNGGELSPEMGGRFDQQRWLTGCHSLLNMVPLPCGGITKRPGLEFMGAAFQTDPAMAARIVPFIFSQSQSRLLEFCQTADAACAMRVWTPDGVCLGRQLYLPWSRAALLSATFCQSADVVFCASPHFRPGRIMRHADDDWRYETISFTPSIQPPTITKLETEGENSGGLVNFYYVATAIDGETGQESAASPAASIQTEALASSHQIILTLSAVEGASEYRVYKRRSGVYGFIGRVNPSQGLEFRDANIEPDTEDTPPAHRDPFWGQGNQPAIVFMHQQRLGFAASNAKPLTVWLSQAGAFESMASSTPPRADDAIEATLAAPEANRILWAQSDRSGLAIGTEGGEWLLQSGEGAALTPSDLSFQPQTYYGSEPGLPVLRAGASIIFPQRGGRALREFGYSFADDRYNSADLSLLARHILRQSPIKAWAWQPEPHGIIWMALQNGGLAGLTYLREHDVIAWHRHATDGQVESLAAIPGPGADTQLWALVIRPAAEGGRRCVERLADFWSGPRLDGPAQSPYACRCVPCLPEAQNESGPSPGLVRKINSIKCRVINTAPFQARAIGPKPGPLQPVPPRGGGEAGEADWPCVLASGFRSGCRVELVLDGPDPATILAITATVELADSLGG